MTTDLSKLPKYKGRPVPWVARWSGERDAGAYSYEILRGNDGRPHLRVYYPDRNENRDPNGTLWLREGIGRGGEPLFSQVNTYRQRLAMRKCLCQVCGTKIVGPIIPFMIDEGIEGPMLDARVPGAVSDEGDPITTTAPVCEDCIEVARLYCPHLRKAGSRIYDVLEYEQWGVYGEMVYFNEGKVDRAQMSISYDDDNIPGFTFNQVLAKQQVVRLTKYRVRS